MTKKKEKVHKKKEELPIGDLILESFKTEPTWEPKWRLSAQVIDSPTQYRMTKPKMVDPMMNMMCYMMTGKSLEELDNE